MHWPLLLLPSSQEACDIVHDYSNATDSCTALVKEAAERWKRFEGR